MHVYKNELDKVNALMGCSPREGRGLHVGLHKPGSHNHGDVAVPVRGAGCMKVRTPVYCHVDLLQSP